LKPLIALIAMTLAVATVAFIVSERSGADVLGQPLGNLPLPTRADVTRTILEAGAVIQIDEVTVVGRSSRSSTQSVLTPPTETMTTSQNGRQR
jgi:hypothetical protein